MNTKKLVLSVVVAYGFVFLFDWLFHEELLAGVYRETATLWRTEEEMIKRFPWLLFGQLTSVVMLCLLFAAGMRPHHVITGVYLGMMLAGFYAGSTFITYAVQPIPAKLMAAWIVGGVVKMMLAGAIVGAIYRPAKPGS